VIKPREPLLQLELHAGHPAVVVRVVDTEPEELHPPLAEHGDGEPVSAGAIWGGAAGLDAVDPYAVEDLEGCDEAGGVHIVDEQLRAGPCMLKRGVRV
jgi:hypothetical protein